MVVDLFAIAQDKAPNVFNLLCSNDHCRKLGRILFEQLCHDRGQIVRKGLDLAAEFHRQPLQKLHQRDSSTVALKALARLTRQTTARQQSRQAKNTRTTIA